MSNTPKHKTHWHSQQLNTDNVLKLLKDIATLNPRLEELQHTSVDILALSCAWWRLRNSPPEQKIFIDSLYSKTLAGKLIEDDMLLARIIREYYSKKITIWQLQGIELTKFRQDLAAFLLTDGKETTGSTTGIVYKLPEFYHYDSEIDHLAETVFNTDVFFKDELLSTQTVIPVKMLTRHTKGAKKLVYFFKRLDNGAGVRSEILHNNMLIHVWNKLFETGEPMLLHGNYAPSGVGFKHYMLRDWKLVNTVKVIGD